MDTSTESSKLDIRQPGLLFGVIHTLQAIGSWLIRFFELSEEDQRKAGIYLGGEGRDG